MSDAVPPPAPGAPAPALGLTQISLPDLDRLQRLLEVGRLTPPLDSTALQAVGLGNIWPSLTPYAALDRQAFRLLLQAAVAERTQRPVPHLELVWTGPDPHASRARDTAVVVRELFQGAQRSVLVAGFRFSHPESILAPFHAAMTERGVEATLFIDLEQWVDRDRQGDVEGAVSTFWQRSWPFPGPRPTLYYDPRTADRAERMNLHAKVVVVDELRALVTSANFTDRAQTRNVELGVLIEDPAFSRLVVEQWRALASHGHFVSPPQT